MSTVTLLSLLEALDNEDIIRITNRRYDLNKDTVRLSITAAPDPDRFKGGFEQIELWTDDFLPTIIRENCIEPALCQFYVKVYIADQTTEERGE
jgi:hypothetical protein